LSAVASAQTGISQQRPSIPKEKHLQQLLAKESKQVPPAKLGILLLLFAGKVDCFVMMRSAVLCHSCCAVLRCAVLCCAVLCCAVLCCAVLRCAVLCCAVLRCAVLSCAALLAPDDVWSVVEYIAIGGRCTLLRRPSSSADAFQNVHSKLTGLAIVQTW